MPNDHYIPQFYLKNFSIPDSNQIYVYRRNRDIFKTNIRNIASVNDFYTFIDKKKKRNRTLEKQFSALEANSAPIIEKIITTEELNLDDKEKNILSNFIAFLFVRDIRFRKKIKDTHSNIMKKSQKILLEQNKGAYRRFSERAGISFKDDSEFEDYCEFIEKEKYDLTFENEDYFLALAIDLGINLLKYIFAKSWNLFLSEGTSFFITSDSPVSLIKNSKLPNFIGLGFLNDLILLPISPKKCLFLSNDFYNDGKTISLKDEKVDLVNTNTMIFSDVSLFSNYISEEIKNSFNAVNKEESIKTNISTRGNLLITQYEYIRSPVKDIDLIN